MSDPTPKRRKANKATVAARVADVVRIRLAGAEHHDLREYALEQGKVEGSPWQLPEGEKPLSDGTLWRYLARADKALADTCRASRKRLIRLHQARRRNLYAKAYEACEWRVCLAILDSEADLMGLKEGETERRLSELERRLGEQEAKHGGNKETTRQLRA